MFLSSKFLCIKTRICRAGRRAEGDGAAKAETGENERAFGRERDNLVDDV
jgi:hypothetical protein